MICLNFGIQAKVSEEWAKDFTQANQATRQVMLMELLYSESVDNEVPVLIEDPVAQ